MKKQYILFHFSIFVLSLVALSNFDVPLSFDATVYAASCCAASSAVPSLITGAENIQTTMSFSQSSIIGDAPAAGLPVFRSDDYDEQSQTMKIDAALSLQSALKIPLQTAVSIPVMRQSLRRGSSSDNATGIGDISASVGYEYFRDSFIFLQSTLPTGGSVYDTARTVDFRGKGFYSLAVGTLVKRDVGIWDALVLAELHHLLPRTFEHSVYSSTESLHLSPGFGGSIFLGTGISPENGPLRIGLGLSPHYEGSIRATGVIDSASSYQLVWDSVAQATYLFNYKYSAALSYVDQTLVGPAKNVSLSRTFTLQTQVKWE